jgi:DNA-binding FrmR family transcriptional regulator
MDEDNREERSLSADQAEVISRLRRIEGQIRGLQRMVEEERPCESIITQLMAARAALDKVGIHIITHYVHECAQTAAPDGSDKERLERALGLFLKLS